MENICLFVPYHKEGDSIHTINYVLETKPQTFTVLKSDSVYKAFLVNGGSGLLHTSGTVRPLSEGDVFFVFPGMLYAIESAEHLSYMYISYLGSRARLIMEKINITGKNFYFPGCGELSDFWKNGLSADAPLADIISESVLLYTFYHIGQKTLVSERQSSRGDTLSVIKKYIDDNFTSADLSLESICREFSYNPKYISAMFKKNMGIGVSGYLSAIRIQHACTMMEQGFTSISDISAACGYKDPLYFSKVFKKKMGISPREHIGQISGK